jgi:hypothetical protein
LASLDTKKSGMHKNSQSVDESKRNGVFRRLINVNKSVVSSGNNKTDTIREIWVEYMWMYTDKGNILKDSAEQLLILFGNASREYDDKILLKRRNDYFGRNGVFCDSYNNLNDTIYVVSRATDNNGTDYCGYEQQ